MNAKKAVFANQMKSVISEVEQGESIAEDGTIIDANFGALSVFARQVNSPFLIGTANVLTRLTSEAAVKIYTGQK